MYSTFLGGGAVDSAFAIALDSSGSAYVTGDTISNDFPTTAGAFERTTPPPGQFPGWAFVTKLAPDGKSLTYSTYLGGASSSAGGRGIAVDQSGSAYVTGGTNSGFPVTPGAFQTTAKSNDAFVSKFKPDGSALMYSTLLGRSLDESGHAIAVDGSGYAYVGGIS